jgi:K+-sensing histidine kinase KdpD
VRFTSGLILGFFIGVNGTMLLLLVTAAMSRERGLLLSQLSLRRVPVIAAAILAVAFMGRALHLHQAAVMLLLLSTVLLIAGAGTMLMGLAAAGIAAAAICFLFLNPIGSFRITDNQDLLTLALFLLLSIVGSRLVAGRGGVA